MLFMYPAIFHKEDKSYWVEFPDLEGCQSFGDTLNECMESAQEALCGYILTLLEDGEKLSKPSDPSSISNDNDSFVSLVTCNVDPYKDTKSVKKTLTIPAWLNDRAVSMGINFSKVLQDGLLMKISQ